MSKEEMKKITIAAIREYQMNAAEYMEKENEVAADNELSKAEAVKNIAIKLGLNE